MPVSLALFRPTLVFGGVTGPLARMCPNGQVVEPLAGVKAGPKTFAQSSSAADLVSGVVLYPLFGLLSPSHVSIAGASLLVLAVASADSLSVIVGAMALGAAQSVRADRPSPNPPLVGRLGDDVVAPSGAYRSIELGTLARPFLSVKTFRGRLSPLILLDGGS